MPSPRQPAPPLVWWTIWFCIMAGQVVMFLVLRQASAKPVTDVFRYLPFAPLALATVVRWVILPRFPGAPGFPLFVAGLALAEACGIMGIFLVPAYSLEYFVLSLVGLAQFAPVFLLGSRPR